MSATTLKHISSNLKLYLRDYRLPEIYEAILCGLCVMCPDIPLDYIMEKIAYLLENGLDNLRWDMFILEAQKPCIRVFAASSVASLFDFDRASEPTPEQNLLAYQHCHDKLVRKGFNAILMYYTMKRLQRQTFEDRVNEARNIFRLKNLKSFFDQWRAYVADEVAREQMAFEKIQKAERSILGCKVLKAWHNYTVEAEITREYFDLLTKVEQSLLNQFDIIYDEKQKLEQSLDEESALGDNAAYTTGMESNALSGLPKNLAIQILSNLTIIELAKCAQVCRSWKILVQASLLWSRIDFSKIKQQICSEVVYQTLTKSRPYLLHVNLKGCEDYVSYQTLMTLRECRNIQDLNMSSCNSLHDDNFIILYNGCQVLHYLNIAYTQISDVTLKMISHNFLNLQYLSIAYCTQITNRGLEFLTAGANGRNLKYLDISGLVAITAPCYRNLTKCISLETLILNDTGVANDVGLKIVFETSYKLSTISLINTPFVSDESLRLLAAHQRLNTIKTEGNPNISDLTFRSFGRNCTNLSHVYLVDCQLITDLSLKFIALCRLVVLNVSDCVRITDTGVRYLAEGTCNTFLRELNLTNCYEIGDLSIVNLHKKCHQLTYLSVCYCDNITETGIELMGHMNNLVSIDITSCNCSDAGVESLGSNVRDLSISECSLITDVGIMKFSQRVPYLSRLDVSFCYFLTDNAMKSLAFSCRLLNYLNICGCKLMTDQSIQYISGVCKYLTEVDISGCILMTDVVTKYFRKGCENLHTLTMLYCAGISRLAVLEMARTLKHVQHNADNVPEYFGYSTITH